MTDHVEARYRRATPCCADESGNFQVSCLKYRVSTPPARPLPLENSLSPPKNINRIHEVFDCDDEILERGVKRILEANGVERLLPMLDDDDSDFFDSSWNSPDDCIFSTQYVTGEIRKGSEAKISILAEWDDAASPVSWVKAVKEIKRFLDIMSQGAGLGTLDIGFEIVDKQHSSDKFVVHTKEFTPELSLGWELIREKVEQMLHSDPVTQGAVRCISLFNTTYHDDWDGQPLGKDHDTVHVSMNYKSDEAKWRPIIIKIEQYLATLPHGLKVHLEHHGLQPYLPACDVEGHLKVQPKLYKTMLGPGDPIGVAGCITSSDGQKILPPMGTLACWVEIKTAGQAGGDGPNTR